MCLESGRFSMDLWISDEESGDEKKNAQAPL